MSQNANFFYGLCFESTVVVILFPKEIILTVDCQGPKLTATLTTALSICQTGLPTTVPATTSSPTTPAPTTPAETTPDPTTERPEDPTTSSVTETTLETEAPTPGKRRECAYMCVRYMCTRMCVSA